LLSVLSKDDCNIVVLFKKIQNFKVSNLVMAKVKNLNIAVTKPETNILAYLPPL
jgi:hypothetical protein